MRDRTVQDGRKRKRPNYSKWTLNQWLEKAWDDGLRRPTEAYLAADCPYDLYYAQPEPLRLSAKAIKALIYMKGWLLKDLASYWRMRPESLSRIIRSKNRSPLVDDAVIGLPLHSHWGDLMRHSVVRDMVLNRAIC